MKIGFNKYLCSTIVGAGALAALAIIPHISGVLSDDLVGMGGHRGDRVALAGLVTEAQAQTSETTENGAPDMAGALPGGASSLNETYDDWIVACTSRSGKSICSMSQQQQNAKTRQRVLAVELRATGKTMEGAAVLPFGLALAKGVSLQIDEGTALPTLSFSTCLPAGCVVPLEFEAGAIGEMAKGAALAITATADGGKSLTMKVSLKGFGAAMARLRALSG